MFVIVPNWNLSFKPKVYKTLKGLKNYADKNFMILSEVSCFKDSEYYSKKYKGLFSSTDTIFIGW